MIAIQAALVCIGIFCAPLAVTGATQKTRKVVTKRKVARSSST